MLTFTESLRSNNSLPSKACPSMSSYQQSLRACRRYTMQVLPPQLRLSTGDVTAAVMWGGTAAVGAVWLVQVSTEHFMGTTCTPYRLGRGFSSPLFVKMWTLTCTVQPFGYIKTLIGGKEPAEAAEEPAPVTEKKQDKPSEEPAPAPDAEKKEEGDE